MNKISVRYGASLSLQVTLKDDGAQTATMYVGMEGEDPVITKTGAFVDGVADISLDTDDTEIPLNVYKYQVNVDYEDGKVLKFPTNSKCTGDNELPDFEVLEALDLNEIVS